MSFKAKCVSVKGVEVNVQCERVYVENSACHRVRFTGAIGEISYSHTHTIGPEDGELPEITAEQLQKDVDAARMQAATHVHFHHSVSTLIPEID